MLGIWDNSQGLAVHDWPLVLLGNDLLEHLTVDFSCFHGPNDSYSVEDVWDGENFILRMFSSGWPPNLEALLAALWWPSLVINMRLFSYYLESRRPMLCPSLVCREHRVLPEGKGSRQR